MLAIANSTEDVFDSISNLSSLKDTTSVVREGRAGNTINTPAQFLLAFLHLMSEQSRYPRL